MRPASGERTEQIRPPDRSCVGGSWRRSICCQWRSTGSGATSAQPNDRATIGARPRSSSPASRRASCLYRNERVFTLANEVASELQQGHLADAQGDPSVDDRRHRDDVIVVAHPRRSSTLVWAFVTRHDLRVVKRCDRGIRQAADRQVRCRMKWYVVHTYSGHENKAKLSLQERVKQTRQGRQFGEILIPTETRRRAGQGPAPHDDAQVLPGLHLRPDGARRGDVPPGQEHPEDHRLPRRTNPHAGARRRRSQNDQRRR